MRSIIEGKIEESKSEDIDLAPLLDVVFILLIFFIVTTVFVKETGVEVDKPTSISSEQLKRSVILLAITADGQVVYAGANVGVAGIRATIIQANKTDQKPVVIQADKTVPTELLVKVIDQAKLAGVKDISLATKG